jgi:hypothetical protein
MSDIPEIKSHGMGPVLMLYAKYQEAVISSCWEENFYEHFLPLTINVKNLTKSVNRKWISHRPEIESHGMGPCVNAVCQILRGCDKYLLRKQLRNIFPRPPAAAGIHHTITRVCSCALRSKIQIIYLIDTWT